MTVNFGLPATTATNSNIPSYCRANSSPLLRFCIFTLLMSDRYRPPAGPKGQRAPQGSKGNWSGSGSKSYYNGPLPKRYKERDNYRPSLIDKERSQDDHMNDRQDRPSGPSGYREKRPHPDRGDGPNKRRDFQRDSRDVRNTRERDLDSRDARDTRDGRDGRDPRDRDGRDPRDRDSRDPRDRNARDRNARDRNARDSRDPRDSRDMRDSRDSQRNNEAGETRYRDPRYRDPGDRDSNRDSNRDPRDRDPRGRRNPNEAKDVMDAAPRGPKANDRKPKEKKKPARAKPPRLDPSQIYLVYSMRATELYQRVQQVGEGTYGKVYKAKNELTGEYVALKKLRLESEREGFPITAIREIKLLQSFDHPNIVGLLEMSVEHNQIHMIFDYLDHDLTGLLTHPDLNLTEGHRKMIFKQLMEGLNYLHARRVIHRDIKGSNILLNSKGVLKIADFGLARNMKVLAEGDKPDYTNRVITIWYRPPELLLGSTDYGREVDIWGVGCLLMELYTKVATFQGTEEISQLYKIFDIMGTPTLESWPDIENMPWFEMLKPRINVMSKFEKEYKHLMSEEGFDLALKLLELVPHKRLTAKEALAHPYFTSDPKPEALTFMETLEGEWHEFETKKRRREERKRLQNIKSSKGKEMSVPPTQPKAPNSTGGNSYSATPFESDFKDAGDSIQDVDMKDNEPSNGKIEGSNGKPDAGTDPAIADAPMADTSTDDTIVSDKALTGVAETNGEPAESELTKSVNTEPIEPEETKDVEATESTGPSPAASGEIES